MNINILMTKRGVKHAKKIESKDLLYNVNLMISI